ncbi:methyltransferase domain-containing protein [Micromonospora wenchangensis]
MLDHGCGRGSDVHHYRTSGLDADGWDPHPGFGQAIEPERQYDLVTNIFVLNVLPDPWQRIQAIQHAARFVRPGGHLFVVTRSPADIDPRAIPANWRTHHDGYWSSEAKGTFQKGIPTEEIIALGHQAGLRPTTQQIPLKTSPAAGQALLVKPKWSGSTPVTATGHRSGTLGGSPAGVGRPDDSGARRPGTPTPPRPARGDAVTPLRPVDGRPG